LPQIIARVTAYVTDRHYTIVQL